MFYYSVLIRSYHCHRFQDLRNSKSQFEQARFNLVNYHKIVDCILVKPKHFSVGIRMPSCDVNGTSTVMGSSMLRWRVKALFKHSNAQNMICSHGSNT